MWRSHLQQTLLWRSQYTQSRRRTLESLSSFARSRDFHILIVSQDCFLYQQKTSRGQMILQCPHQNNRWLCHTSVLKTYLNYEKLPVCSIIFRIVCKKSREISRNPYCQCRLSRRFCVSAVLTNEKPRLLARPIGRK